MNGEQLGRELGQLGESIKNISEKVDSLSGRLDNHISDERARLESYTEKIDGRLKHIDQQLSLGRFMMLTAKGIGLTVVALLAFKFGDVSHLWKTLFK